MPDSKNDIVIMCVVTCAVRQDLAKFGHSGKFIIDNTNKPCILVSFFE